MQHDRQLRIIYAATLDEATSLYRTKAKLATAGVKGSLTIIDTTRDQNQNRWIGRELEDTLIFFNDKTTINNLLALWGCVKAPHTIYLAFDPELMTGYFKHFVLIPRLLAIAEKKPMLGNIKKTATVDDILPVDVIGSLQQKNIVHLIGLRGSGKSTLLGQIIKQLLANDGTTCIALSSPYSTASENTRKYISHVSRETFAYLAPDVLLENMDNFQIIVVDEAAMLAKSLITRVIEHVNENHKKLILATTIEGYEGTGQGYRINMLNAKVANEKFIELKTPKRFSESDPIHQLSQYLCWPESHRYSLCYLSDGAYLFNTEDLRSHRLTEPCFALLHSAHYKTTPNDLERFYNAPALFAIIIKDRTIVSVAYCLSESLIVNGQGINDIFYGLSRRKNAMTQQAIVHAYGYTGIANKKILRICRIATRIENRQQGFASQLVGKIEYYAIAEGYDYLSASFSLNKNRLRFWQKQRFKPIRVGLQKNKINNQYAILCLKSIKKTLNINYLHGLYKQHITYFKHSYGMIVTKSMFADSAEELSMQYHVLSIDKQIDSVLKGHRDINWLLPILSKVYDPAHLHRTASIQSLNTLSNGLLLRWYCKKQAMDMLNNGYCG